MQETNYKHLFVFRHKLGPEEIPHAACQTDGGIGAAHDTHHERQRKIPDTGHAEEIQHGNHDKGGQRGKDTSRHGLGDTLIHRLLQIGRAHV